MLISGAGLGAVAANKETAAVLSEVVRDPLFAFSQRSPGERRPGALFQTKRAKMAVAPPLAAPAAPPVEMSAIAPPFTQAADDRLCERLTAAAPVVALTPASPAVDRLAGQLVQAVQQALADNATGGQAQREDAVERKIEQVLESTNADPAVARPALDVAQARLAALGLSCAPGVPQAMKVATTAAVQALPPNDLQPASISPPGPPPFSVPPLTGGGGGGGSTTHPSAQ